MNNVAAGFLDSIYIKDDNVIFSGWAKCSGLKNTFVTLFSDSKPISSGIADLYREDLKGTVSETGFNAFEITVPCDLVKGSPVFEIFAHTLTDLIPLNISHAKNHLVSGDENLFIEGGCKLTEILCSETGYKHDLTIDNGSIICSFISRTNLINDDISCFKDLTVAVGGKKVEIEKFLTNKKLTNTNAIVKSFIDIPIESIMLGKEVTVRYFDEILTSLVISKNARLIGFIEEVRVHEDKVEVIGWAHDHYKKMEKKSVDVCLEINGEQVLGKTLAGSFRGDLKKYLGYGHCAFYIEFSVDCNVGDEIAVFASVKDDVGEFRLNKASSFKVVFLEIPLEEKNDLTTLADEKDTIVGSVDKVNNNILTGWAKNATQPGVPVLLDIYLDGTLFVSSWANRYRPDLAKHFGDDGCHAFQVDIAPNINTFTGMDIKVLPRVGVNKINQKINFLEQKSRMKHINEEQGL